MRKKAVLPLLGMDPPQPASEIFVSVTKEAQRVLRIPNDYVEKKHKTSRYIHNKKCSESIWEEEDFVTAGWQRAELKEIENRSDISVGRAQKKKERRL